MNDALLVGMLHRLANIDEQLQAVRGREGDCSSQNVGDRDAPDQFHDEVRPAACRSSPASRTLAMFGWSIKASACRSASKRAITWRVSMPGLMHLQGDPAAHRLVLLGHEDDPEAAFADLFQQFVRPDNAAGILVCPRVAGCIADGGRGDTGRLQETPILFMHAQHAWIRAPSAALPLHI